MYKFDITKILGLRQPMPNGEADSYHEVQRPQQLVSPSRNNCTQSPVKGNALTQSGVDGRYPTIEKPFEDTQRALFDSDSFHLPVAIWADVILQS
mmetsp:Transcript_16289/g.34405  ORF Transcript_16289/g.34405 Transcript_16289/m.34405 type:complete len:95 (-) Transcript_16289:93-377(-)